MTSKLQDEALSFFHGDVNNWRTDKVPAEYKGRIKTTLQRNNYILYVIEHRDETKAVLDVGCGTGDLIHEIARKGIKGVGVDFVQGMIDVAREKIDHNVMKDIVFSRASIFDCNYEPESFDVIAANGFVEYLSHEELKHFFDLSFKWLKKGGSLIFSSRNRLFNIFSLNALTEPEIKDGTINKMLLELYALVNGLRMEKLSDFDCVDFPDENARQFNTSKVAVSIRLQYTPAQLAKILRQSNLQTVALSPINIHGVLPKFKQDNIDIHWRIADLLEPHIIENLLFLAQASTFMVHAKKI
jgi:SAM-dependent methyltransferase